MKQILGILKLMSWLLDLESIDPNRCKNCKLENYTQAIIVEDRKWVSNNVVGYAKRRGPPRGESKRAVVVKHREKKERIKCQ